MGIQLMDSFTFANKNEIGNTGIKAPFRCSDKPYYAEGRNTNRCASGSKLGMEGLYMYLTRQIKKSYINTNDDIVLLFEKADESKAYYVIYDRDNSRFTYSIYDLETKKCINDGYRENDNFRHLTMFSVLLGEMINKNSLFKNFMKKANNSYGKAINGNKQEYEAQMNESMKCLLRLHDELYFDYIHTEFDVRYKKLENWTKAESDFVETVNLLEDYIVDPTTAVDTGRFSRKKRKRKKAVTEESVGLPQMSIQNHNASLVPKYDEVHPLSEDMYPYATAIAEGLATSFLQYGPTRTGKSTTVRNICAKINLPLVCEMICTKHSDESMLGKFIPVEGEGTFKFVESNLTKAIRNGGAAVIEEINMAKPEHLAFLNSLLDLNSMITLETGEVVKKHEDFRLFATMNHGYVGTSDLNPSLTKRFELIAKVDSIDMDSVIKELQGMKLKNKVIDDMLEVYKRIESQIENQCLDAIVTAEDLIRWGKYIRVFGYKKAAEATIVHSCLYDEEIYESFMNIIELFSYEGVDIKEMYVS